MLESGTVITPELKGLWLAERASTVGASDAYSAAHAPLELFLQKTGRLAPVEVNDRMRAGLLLEPALAAAYLAETGHGVACQQVYVRHPDHRGLTATLDGLRPDGVPVEFKCVSRYAEGRFGEPGTDEVPDRYLYQCQHQMLVTGAPRVDLFAFFGGDLRFGLYPVERNETLVRILEEVELEFLDRLRTDTPPPLDGVADPALVAALHTRCEGFTLLTDAHARAASAYLALGETVREVEKERDAAKAILLAGLGDCAEGELPDGRTVRRSKITTPDRTVKGSTYFRLSIKEPRL